LTRSTPCCASKPTLGEPLLLQRQPKIHAAA
jgi:hypothetical protein